MTMELLRQILSHCRIRMYGNAAYYSFDCFSRPSVISIYSNDGHIVGYIEVAEVEAVMKEVGVSA